MKEFLLRIESDLYEQLKKEAKENHWTLSTYIRKILYERGK